MFGLVILIISTIVNNFSYNKENSDSIIPENIKSEYIEYKDERYDVHIKTLGNNNNNHASGMAKRDADLKYELKTEVKNGVWFNPTYKTFFTISLVFSTMFIWLYLLCAVYVWNHNREEFLKEKRKILLTDYEKRKQFEQDLEDPNFDPLNK